MMKIRTLWWVIRCDFGGREEEEGRKEGIRILNE